LTCVYILYSREQSTTPLFNLATPPFQTIIIFIIQYVKKIQALNSGIFSDLAHHLKYLMEKDKDKTSNKEGINMETIKTTLREFVIPFTISQVITAVILAGMAYLWLR